MSQTKEQEAASVKALEKFWGEDEAYERAFGVPPPGKKSEALELETVEALPMSTSSLLRSLANEVEQIEKERDSFSEQADILVIENARLLDAEAMWSEECKCLRYDVSGERKAKWKAQGELRKVKGDLRFLNWFFFLYFIFSVLSVAAVIKFAKSSLLM